MAKKSASSSTARRQRALARAERLVGDLVDGDTLSLQEPPERTMGLQDSSEPTLIQRIAEAIASDDHDDSDDIQYWYQRATEAEQRAIDRIFLHLCGWKLRSLINPRRVDPNYRPFEGV
jgi:hypothetical protein